MKKLFRILLILVFMISYGFSAKSKAEEKSKSYDFSLTDTSDQKVNLADYKGKQDVVLFFWASWCAFCRGEIKKIVKRYPELKQNNIEVLAINVEENKKTVQRFFSREKINFRVLLDKDGKVASSYGIVGIPTFIWIDKDGQIKYEGHTFPDLPEKAN